MDERTRRAIVRLEVVEDGEVISRGTGFLVAPELLLTALHVAADRKNTPPRALPGELRAWFFGEREPRPARLLLEYAGASDDFALLACTPPPESRPLPLGVLEKSGGTWEAHGFPDTTPIDGMGFGGEVRSHFATYQGAAAMQLYSLEAAAGKGAPVHGLSGAPCLVGGVVTGVIRSAILDGKNSVAGTIWACPVASVLARCQTLLRIPDPYWGLPGLAHHPLPREPFRYLAPFEEKHAEIFFGRGWEIRDLHQLVSSPTSPQVILVYGQSGVGKSSILAAGLVPRLLATHTVQYRRRLATRTLLDELKDAIAATPKPEVVILDQIEEVLTQDGGRRHAELDALCAEAKNIHPGKLVLGFRKEYYAEVERRLEEHNYPRPARRFIERIAAPGVIEAVTGLTRTQRLRETYNLSVEDGVAEKIATQVLADPASPAAATLQIRLTRLWERATAIKSDAPRFTHALADELDRHKLDVRRLFDEQMDKLHASESSASPALSSVASGLALDILFHHTTELGTAAEHDDRELLARYGHVREKAARTIQKLEDLYLLADAKSEGTHRARLAHDTLAPVVRDAFARSNAPGQHARRLLETRGLAWRDGSTGELLEDRELTELKRGIDGMRAPTADESRLLEASLREAANARRRKTVQRVFTVVTGIAAIALGALTWWNQNKQDATAAAGAYQSAQIAAEERHDVLDALVSLRDAIEKSGADKKRRAVYLSRFLQLAELAPKSIYRVDADARRTFFDELGARVLVETNRGELQVWSLGETATRIATAPPAMQTFGLFNNTPAISGDGKVIAMRVGYELFAYALDTARLTQATNETTLRCCTLSRDGARVYGVQPTSQPWVMEGWLFDIPSAQFIGAPRARVEHGPTEDGLVASVFCAPPIDSPAGDRIALENPTASARCEKEVLNYEMIGGWTIASSTAGVELSKMPLRGWRFCRSGGCVPIPGTSQKILPPRAAAVSGDALLTLSQTDELEVFDVPTGRWRRPPLRVNEQLGSALALPEEEILIAVRRGLIYRWKTSPNIAGISSVLGTSTAAVDGAAFDPQRRVVALAREKSGLEVYSVAEGRNLWSRPLLPVPSNRTALAFDSSGTRLAVAHDAAVSLFDGGDGSALWPRSAIAGGRLLALAFRGAPAAEVVGVWDDIAGWRQVVEVWDVQTGASKAVECELERNGFDEVRFAAGGLALEFSRAGRSTSRVELTGPARCRSARDSKPAPTDGARSTDSDDARSTDSDDARATHANDARAGLAPNLAALELADRSASGRWALTDSGHDAQDPRYFRVWDSRTGTPLTAPIYRDAIAAALTPDDRGLLFVDAGGRLERLRIAVADDSFPAWLERATNFFSLAGRRPDDAALRSLAAERKEVRAEVEEAAASGDERAAWLKQLFDHLDARKN